MTGTLHAGAVSIAYREGGAGDPVVLINGTGESGATWAGLMGRLEDRWRCIAYDPRDTGGTVAPAEPYTPRDLAGDAAAVIERLELGAAHVVGFSLGGATAQELALARPELVRSLVLLSTWARSDGWFAAEMRNWQAIRRAHADDDHAFLLALEAWMFSPATCADDELRASIYAMWDTDTGQPVDGWIRQTEADIAHDAAGRLEQVTAPALIVVGDDDVCTPPRYSRELFDLLPDAELVTIPDAGHCAVFEKPDAVAGVIRDFLAAH